MASLSRGRALCFGAPAFTWARGPGARLVERFGDGPYKVAYSLISVLGVVLVAIGYGRYRSYGWIDVWSPPVWTRHLALLLVLAAFVCLAAAYLPGRIKRATKHPMLLAVKIWATAHLMANGDLGSSLLFGSLLAWAVVARISAKRRDEVQVHGGEVAARAGLRNDLSAVAIGTAAWFVFAYWLHPILIGVAVWPTRA